MNSSRATVGLCVLLATGCSRSAATSAPCPPSPYLASPPKVIAHAGGEGLGPENTLLAMRRSMAAGADILDVDVWMSADGIVVARHDRELSTTTDGSGNIDEYTFAELQQLDAAARWTGEAIDEAVRIPSLDEILTEFTDVTVSIEIKQTLPSMAVQLCDVLVRTDSVERVYLSANDDDAVYAAQAECPDATLITTTYRDLDERRAAQAAGEPWCSVSPIGQPPWAEGRFSRERVAESHARGAAIYTWTIDDPDELRRLAEAGVDGVYTRRPDIARQVFDEFARGG
jgi:glycerophosphoryl diester phosphodiesterase